MERYYSANQYMQEAFGCKVYKLAIDGDFTCPNRDGTCGSRGCIFCSGGSGDFAVPVGDNVFEAIEQAKLVVGNKNASGKYIAYFQSYTNTYAPIEKLRSLYEKAISHPDIVALDIATRPDCLDNSVITLLKEFNEAKPVWVELGLQTIHASTARYIRRGYDLPVFDEAMQKLKEAGLYTIVHMILGLPGESEGQIYATADYIGHSGADGIKLQLLHVLQNTDLAKEYAAGVFQELSLPTYIHLLEGCVQRLPPTMAIHRLTGDGAKRDLIAPLWSANKKSVLNAIQKAFAEDDIVQGSLYQE